jgi:outer membrane PBP1 activator LpoA protein
MAAPYLPRQVPTYAASVVHTLRPDPASDIDMEGIHVFEMPWLVQPDHPAVMVYPRPDDITGDLQRFYALGIDACRLAPLLARHQEAFEVDGVTGHIRGGPAGMIEREPVPAVFRGGAPVAEP